MKDSANLDLLRATAVVLVAVFHALLYAGHLTREIGEFGVLLFFVHTSLVLMFSLERQQLDYPTAPIFLTFMVRRCFRVYPLSVLVVASFFILHLPLADIRRGTFVGLEPHFK